MTGPKKPSARRSGSSHRTPTPWWTRAASPKFYGARCASRLAHGRNFWCAYALESCNTALGRGDWRPPRFGRVGHAPVTPFVWTLVLAAALLHATWNAVLRGGSDR